jgi:hypothetical protein
VHTMRQRSMFERMQGAATLDIDTYEEVEADTTATQQAAMVVLVVALAQAVGSAGMGVGAAAAGMIAAFLGWLLWAGVTYLVGDKLLGGTATWGELLRTLGFAQSPGVLYALAIIPVVGGLVRFAVGIWILVAGIIAIRQACDFSTGKAVLTAVIGWLFLAIPLLALGLIANRAGLGA